GWSHPLPDQLVVSAGSALLLRPPRSIVTVAGTVPLPEVGELLLKRVRPRTLGSRPQVPPVGVQLTLAVRPTPAKEMLWVLDAAGETQFGGFCYEADERVLRRLEVATVSAGSDTRLVVRTIGKRSAGFLPLRSAGFAPDPRIAGLYVPAMQ